MSRRCFTASGALFTLIFVVPGCSYEVSVPLGGPTGAAQGLKESEVVPAQRFEVQDTPRVVVEDQVGSLVAIASDDGVVVVEAVKRAATKDALATITPEVAQENGKITVRWRPSGQIVENRALDITIKAPKTAALTLETGNGAITVEGFTRRVEVKTGVGPITMKRAAGELTLYSGNGAISVEGATGAVKAETMVGPIILKGTKGSRTAHTGNGDVLIDGAEGAVSAQTQVGRIEVKHAKGDMTLHSGNGAVAVRDAEGAVVVETSVGTVDVAGRLAGASRLSSGNGTIALSLPADSRLTINAATGNGTITNAFRLPVEGTVTSVCKGMIGDGSSGSIRLETMVGGISLTKK